MKSIVALLLTSICLCVAQKESPSTPSFEWKRFKVENRDAFVILPKTTSGKEIPWVWYAPTFGSSLPNARDEGWMIERFLKAGIAIAGIDVGESYGSPNGRTLYNQFYDYVRSQHQFAPKATLLARSRGGLMLYCWAVENANKVQCIVGIYPVCDITSYPGINRAAKAYESTPAKLKEDIAKHNPIPRLQPLANAKVPIFHIHGEVDKVVPLEANSQALATEYKRLGGTMEILVPKGQGHNMWSGFFQCQELVDFVLKHHK